MRLACVFLLLALAANLLYAVNATVVAEDSDKASWSGLAVEHCGVVTERLGIVREPVDPDGYAGPVVLVAVVEGVIGGWTERYIQRVLETAESRSAILLIELETPGGLLDSTLSIVNAISRARVPVVTYGRGKWVESAGALILVSGHVAAMAPGTITGSLQPVVLDPTGGYVPVNDTKIINPIIKTLCEHGVSKGRNATALVRMVTHNANYGAEEAVRLGVVEFTARSREELLSQINGLKVRLYDGRVVELRTAGFYEEIPLSFSERLLKILSDPLLSGIALSIGTITLVFSIVNSNPLGIALGISLILIGLLGYGFSVDVVSLALIGIGAALLIAELLSPGFGVMGASGVVLISIGAALIPVTSGFAASKTYLYQVLGALLAVSIIAGLFVAFLIYKAVKAQRAEPVLGRMRGAMGVAVDDITPEGYGFVLIDGEYWKATSRVRIARGEKVVVVGKDGPVLVVEPAGRRGGQS